MSTDDRTQIGQSFGVQPGTQLNGIYEIDEKIAAGGMGEVYRGHNIQTGDPVAIKIVLPDFAKDPTILALFRKEASVLNHLAHGAIVRYYVFSIDPGIGRPYLAMEFVDGKSLAEVMEAGPMATPDAELLIGRVASGLGAAHEAGVIHRDLSPDNIILSGGRVSKAKIIDFGIARSETIGGGTLLGGRFAGKYNFVSPEQLGLFGGEVSSRSDIYSLGLVFAAALRGEALNMSGSQVDVIEKRRTVPPLDDIDPTMRPIVEAMLQPDPADRPESMALIEEWLTPARPLRPSSDTRSIAPGRGGAELPSGATVLSSQPPFYGTTPPAPRGTGVPHGSGRTGAPSAGGGTGRPRGASAPPYAAPPDEKTSPPSDSDWQEEEEPYHYVASNPPFADTSPSDAGSEGEGDDARRGSRGRTKLLAAIGLLLVVGGGLGAAWYAGLFDGEPTSQTAAPAPAGPATGTGTAPAPPPDPPQTPAVPTPVETRIAKAATAIEWIRAYDGGACFFARTLAATDTSISVEGLGTSPEPFRVMESAFVKANGYEPNVDLRQIAERQCPLADFMRSVGRLGGANPVLELNNDRIRSGQALQGVATGLASRSSISLWLIDNDGVVYDLNNYLRRSGERATFTINIKLVDQKTGAPLPHLIFAITSDLPLESTSHTEPMRLAAFLDGVSKEISGNPGKVGVAATYFELGG